MNGFFVHAKPELIFGADASLTTGTRLKKFKCTKIICVYDKGVKAAGLVDKIVRSSETGMNIPQCLQKRQLNL